MKKISVLTILCLTALFGSANGFRGNGDNYKFEQKKDIEKSFEMDANSILEMEGIYSDFIITEWDQPQIDFSVKVVVKSNDEKKAIARLNSINIVFERLGNKITAKTVFENYPYRNFNGYTSIKYYVKVPKDVFMDLETKYGDITVNNVRKKFEADIKYGNLNADSLLADNDIDISYGNISATYAKNIYLDLKYGNAKMNKIAHIEGEIKYSNFIATEINRGVLNNRYSDVKIEKIDKLNTKNQYSDMRITNVAHTLEAKIQYSDLKATCDGLYPNINIEGQYSDVNLKISENASFTYNLKTTYGDIKCKGILDFTGSEARGNYGKGESGSIAVQLLYGDLRINK